MGWGTDPLATDQDLLEFSKVIAGHKNRGTRLDSEIGQARAILKQKGGPISWLAGAATMGMATDSQPVQALDADVKTALTGLGTDVLGAFTRGAPALYGGLETEAMGLAREKTADAIHRMGTGFDVAKQETDLPGFHGVVERGGRNLLRSLPIAVVGGQLGGSYGALGPATAITYSRSLQEGRDAGLEGASLQKYAGEQAAWEGIITAAFQKIGLGGVEGAAAKKAIQGGLGKAFKDLLIQTGGEIAEEEAIMLRQAATDVAYGVDPNALDLDVLMNNAYETAVAAGMASGAVQGPQTAVAAFAEPTPTKEQASIAHFDNVRRIVSQSRAAGTNAQVEALAAHETPTRKQWTAAGLPDRLGRSSAVRQQFAENLRFLLSREQGAQPQGVTSEPEVPELQVGQSQTDQPPPAPTAEAQAPPVETPVVLDAQQIVDPAILDDVRARTKVQGPAGLEDKIQREIAAIETEAQRQKEEALSRLSKPELDAEEDRVDPEAVARLAGQGRPSVIDLSGMGAAISANLIDSLWKKVQAGETSENGQPSALLQVAKLAKSMGGLQTKEQFAALAQEYGAISETGQARQTALSALAAKYVPRAPQQDRGRVAASVQEHLRNQGVSETDMPSLGQIATLLEAGSNPDLIVNAVLQGWLAQLGPAQQGPVVPTNEPAPPLVHPTEPQPRIAPQPQQLPPLEITEQGAAPQPAPAITDAHRQAANLPPDEIRAIKDDNQLAALEATLDEAVRLRPRESKYRIQRKAVQTHRKQLREAAPPPVAQPEAPEAAESGLETMSDDEAPPKVGTAADAKFRKDVRAMFPGAKVERSARGYVVHVGGSWLEVRPAKKIEFKMTREQADRTYGFKLTDAQWDWIQRHGAPGKYTLTEPDGKRHSGLGIIKMALDIYDKSTTLHEPLHLARKYFLTEQEWSVLAERYGDPQDLAQLKELDKKRRLGTLTPEERGAYNALDRKVEEAVAKARETWSDNKTLWERIKRWLLSLAGLTEKDADDLMKMMQDAAFWQRQALDRKAAQEQAEEAIRAPKEAELESRKTEASIERKRLKARKKELEQSADSVTQGTPEYQAHWAEYRDVIQKLKDIHRELTAMGVSVGKSKDIMDRAERGKLPKEYYQAPSLPGEMGPKFYSKLAEVAASTKVGKVVNKDQLLATLRNAGVKEEEIDDMRLADAFAGKKSLTKDELLAYIADKAVRVEEVTREAGGEAGFLENRLRTIEARMVELESFEIGDDPAEQAEAETIRAEIDTQRRELSSEYVSVRRKIESLGGSKPTKFQQFQLPGGQNYRELLLTVPVKSKKRDVSGRLAEIEARRLEIRAAEERGEATDYEEDNRLIDEEGALLTEQETGPGFRSSHWDEPNVLAHVRFNDRTDADGKKVLFIEEIQSDWHQKASKHRRREIRRRAKERGIARPRAGEAPSPEYAAISKEVPENFGYDRAVKEFEAYYIDKEGQVVPLGYGETPEQARSNAGEEWERILNVAGMEMQVRELEDGWKSEGVPDAPMKKTGTWAMMAMKRMIRWAAEKGYERVAWTPGEVQRERYGLLGGGVQSISWRDGDRTRPDRTPNRIISAQVAGGKQVEIEATPDGITVEASLNGNMHPELMGRRLDDIVGDDIAEQIMDEPQGKIEGEGLKISERGMAGFYDQILPAETNKIIKKYGARVGRTEIQQPDPRWGPNHPEINNLTHAAQVHAFDITDSMRQDVLEKGLPYYQVKIPGHLLPADPGQADRIQKAYGRQAPSIWERIKNVVTSFAEAATRAHLNIPNTKEFDADREQFRLLKNIPTVAQDEADRTVQRVAGELDGNELQLFSMKTVAANALASLRRGERMAPFGMNEQDLEAWLEQLDGEVAKNPKVQAALDTRKKEVHELVDRLVAEELLPPEAKERADEYLHQQVLLFQRMSGRRLRGGKSPFQKARTKDAGDLGPDLDYNTSYIESEFAWMRDAHARLGYKAWFDELAKRRDRSDVFKQLAKQTGQDWEDLVRQSKEYELIQRDPGRILYKAMALDERLVEEILLGLATDLNISPDQLRSVTALGRQRAQMALPKELVAEIQRIEDQALPNEWKRLARSTHSAWKSWTLNAPHNIIPYTARNLLGDTDAVVGGGAFWAAPHLPKAFQLLRGYYGIRRERAGTLDPILKAARDYAVVGSSLSSQELPDTPGLTKLERFYNAAKNPAGKAWDATWGAYWKTVKKYSSFREEISRLAVFMYYRDALAKGTLSHYGGASKRVVDAIHRELGLDAAAAHLARNVVGDYGDLTVLGQTLRNYTHPFYSWLEINAKRYPVFAYNAALFGPRKFGAKNPAAYAASAAALGTIALPYILMQLYNNIFFGDEEDELTDDERASPHLILPGRNADGTIRILRNTSAFGDFAEWFGLNTVVARLDELSAGQMTGRDLLQEVGRATANKAAQGVRPELKAPAEIASGRSTFPDIFNWRPVARDEQLMSYLGFQDVYRAAKGKALGSGLRGRPHMIQRELFGVSDPRKNALTEIYTLRDRYLGKLGQQVPMRGNEYFRNMREAAAANDQKAFEEGMRAYLENGGTYEKFKASLKSLDPIASRLTEEDERKFEEWLTADQREKLLVARDYAQRLSVEMFAMWQEGSEGVDLTPEVTQEGGPESIATRLKGARGAEKDRLLKSLDEWVQTNLEVGGLLDQDPQRMSPILRRRVRAAVAKMVRVPRPVKRHLGDESYQDTIAKWREKRDSARAWLRTRQNTRLMRGLGFKA